MPRLCPTALLNVLNSQTPTLAVLCKITRTDGTVLGFTTCDLDLTVNGVLYERQSAIQATNARSTTGVGIDNLDVTGLLNSNKITDADVLGGKYDLASVEIDICDYTNPAAGVMILLTGVLGEITISEGQYIAEFRSLSQYLGQEVTDVTQPTCRAPTFGDPNTCASGGFIGAQTLSFYQRPSRTVITANADGSFTCAVTDTTNVFDYGMCQFTSGANSGITKEIKTSGVSAGVCTVVLRENFPFAIAPGDQCTLTYGCDRKFSTCVNTFANKANFRGEPQMPLIDKINQRGRR